MEQPMKTLLQLAFVCVGLAFVFTSLSTGCSPTCGIECSGCCGSDGICYTGGAPKYCGLFGVACVDCTSTGQTCSSDEGTCEGGSTGSTGTSGSTGSTCASQGQDCFSKACCAGLGCQLDVCTVCGASGQGCIQNSDCCSENCYCGANGTVCE
jgi:hypothetical protein